MTKIISIEEHRSFKDSPLYNELFGTNEALMKKFPDALNAKGNHLLGCFVEGWPVPTPRASYYVGLTWLEPEKVALQVYPKISKLDFLGMFMTCLKCKDYDVQDKVMEIYGLDLKKPLIEANGLHVEVTPFIIFHFLSLLEPIVKKGLKHNYVFSEENLQSKLKGKLIFMQHLKKNVLKNRPDKNYCRFQEYSVDCLENRILKKALYFAESYIQHYRLKLSNDFINIIHKSHNAFAEVDTDCSPSEIERFRVNPLFREYARAINIAKLILRRFGYDIRRTDKQLNMVPPFWIDMGLLFETYVLGLLKGKYGRGIKYHIATNGNEIDFGKPDEKMIIDTKYIFHWEDKVNHDNIRQLSGYARNLQIRRKLMGEVYEKEILPCMIVYPDANGIECFTQQQILNEPCEEIDSYLKFYKIGIKLPSK